MEVRKIDFQPFLYWDIKLNKTNIKTCGMQLRGEFVAKVHERESQTCCLHLVRVCVEFCTDKFIGKNVVIVEYLHLSFGEKFLLSSYYRLDILLQVW